MERLYITFLEAWIGVVYISAPPANTNRWYCQCYKLYRLHHKFRNYSASIAYNHSYPSTTKYVLKKHNDNTKNTKTNNDTKTCNCRRPEECPVSNTCLTKSWVYKAEVSTDKDDAKVYIGVTANTFKRKIQKSHKVH